MYFSITGLEWNQVIISDLQMCATHKVTAGVVNYN